MILLFCFSFFLKVVDRLNCVFDELGRGLELGEFVAVERERERRDNSATADEERHRNSGVLDACDIGHRSADGHDGLFVVDDGLDDGGQGGTNPIVSRTLVFDDVVSRSANFGIDVFLDSIVEQDLSSLAKVCERDAADGDQRPQENF